MITTISDSVLDGTIIKVIGVGGAGGNAVRHMIEKGFSAVEFICANTDAQALAKTGAGTLLKLGDTGLGAGANPEVGREAARESKKRIVEALQGAHMVFVTAGMGGGTGTGAAPVIAEIAREMGILTVGVVTKPFGFEGKRRGRQAMEGIDELAKSVNSLIVVLNDRLLDVLGEDVTQAEAFAEADDILYSAVAGITEIINCEGVVNVDFEDVRTVMGARGRAMMGYGVASGPDRAAAAAEKAIACPLLEGVNLASAKGVLVNVTASSDSLRMREPRIVMDIIQSYVDEDATIIYGAVYDERMGDEMRVTVVASGLEDALGAVKAAAPAASVVVVRAVPPAFVPTLTAAVKPAQLLPHLRPSPDRYAELDRPAVYRSNRVTALETQAAIEEASAPATGFHDTSPPVIRIPGAVAMNEAAAQPTVRAPVRPLVDSAALETYIPNWLRNKRTAV